ncbi:hypothetical protein [Streptomyces sp. NPDC047928]|uniref:hypothetical protein n=1 Tax=unclassified Streptomyces TaxID=2593676 RepID=UPI00372349CF
MPPRLRKAVLTAHVATSVGWLGAVVAYLALDIAAVTGEDTDAVRGAYLAMDVVVRYAIVPLALATVAIGIVNALGTSWGLFRHYWVVVKLLLTVLAAGVLLMEARTVARLADAAASGADPLALPGTLPHSVGGLAVLLVTTAVSVFKPRGMTRYGWRETQAGSRTNTPVPPTGTG